MNSRERVWALLDGQPFDCLPCMPLTMMFASDRLGVLYRDYARDYRVLVEGQVRVAEEFDFDDVSFCTDPACEAADRGAAVMYFPNQPPALDESHALLTDKCRLATPRVPDPYASGRMNNGLQAVAMLKERVGQEKVVEAWVEGPIAEAADLRGINTIMLDVYDDPGFVRDLFAFVVEMELGWAKAEIAAGADLVAIGDAAASLVNPRTYAELVWPCEKKMVDAIHSLGARVRLHICGDTRLILEDIGRLGCDIVDLDSLAPVALAREKMGPHQVVMGNIAPVQTLRDGTQACIWQELAECHRQAGDRFVVGVGCEIPRDTPPENVRVLSEYARSHSGARQTFIEHRKVTMKIKVYLPALLLLLGFGVAASAEPTGDTWNVVLPVNLDVRVEGQIQELAVQEQAAVHFFRGLREVPRLTNGRGEILIELRQEKASFLTALKAEAGRAAIQPTGELAREGYILEASYPGASLPNNFRITAATAEGIHCALLRIPALLRTPAPNVATGLIPAPQAVRTTQSGSKIIIADYPGFAERGVVEGFYGRPWGHQDRLAVLRFEGRHGMNVYYYGPMDDPYNRKLWREPYPAAEMRRMRELVDGARRNFVDFCFALNPGLSMTYSSEGDFAALTGKLASLAKLGVSCFSLCLGDIPEALQNPADQARYPTLAAAHADLINRLYRHLKALSPQNRLTITPVTYTSAWGSRDYIRELGAGVDPDVELIWSGPDVASPAITLPQAKEWGEYLHRKPLIWDNFPTNDGQGWRLNLGPLRGRDRNLNAAVRGLIANPMDQAVASLIPLETVADYLWNPTAYDAEKSENHALTSQYGEDAPQLLDAYVKTYSDYYWDDNLFTPLFVERRYAFDPAAMRRAIAALEASLGHLRQQARFTRLFPELSPFPNQTRVRLEQVEADPAFCKLPDGKLQWRDDHDVLSAGRFAQHPRLDGDFGKWQGRTLYTLNQEAQADHRDKSRSGVQGFFVRVGLGWDEQYLYVGVDVKDSDVYQPFFGRGIQDGDAFILALEAAFRKDFLMGQRHGNLYPLYFSPGDFAGVKPSIFLDDGHLPPHPQPHDCNKEIKTAWKKTPLGFSGDIAVPASFFEGGAFAKRYEIGINLGGQKVIRPAASGKPQAPGGIIYLTSKRDKLFPFEGDNPASYQRLVLTDTE